jgi:type IV pilus assembly protein PilV
MSPREGSRFGATANRTHGFSLFEVMVALVIISIGLLGVAKMQALAYASTSTASMRSLAAIEAASLASAMRANRSYWAVGAAPVAITITGTAAAANFCTPAGSAPCTPAQLAAFDLHQWATALNGLLPNPTATISCPTVVTPINCTIQINWAEKMVAINAQGAGGPAMQAPTYILYVEP